MKKLRPILLAEGIGSRLWPPLTEHSYGKVDLH